MPSPEMQAFFSWFQSHHGYVNTSVMDVVDFPLSEGGRGAVAIANIPANHVVFSIPRSLVLSPRTSTLPANMGANAWKKFKLHKGWAGLILCMMWEASRGGESLWAPYFDTLPTRFDTPMFWSEGDLQELQGTSVVDKLGKEEAEKDYLRKVLPAIQSRPDLFKKEDIESRFSLDVFHMMGTRISSRSFTLAKDEDEEGDGAEKEEGHEASTTGEQHDHDDHDHDVGNTSTGSAMDVDEPSEEDEDEDDEDEGEEEAAEIAMVPLADILNARYKTENVKLFYEPDRLEMKSTRVIKAGEQIWNTYGDLPNAELLRGYGHVDYIPLPSSFALGTAGQQEYGNPGDTVDVRADLVVRCVLDAMSEDKSGVKEADVEERIDWWLEEGGDDVFTFEHPSLALFPDTDTLTSEPAPSPTTSTTTTTTTNPNQPLSLPQHLENLTTILTPPLLSFIRLIQLTPQEWTKAKAKGRPPKPSPGDITTLRILSDVCRRRMGMYRGGGGVEEDLNTAATALNTLSTNKRHALIVRLGEKRVVEGVARCVREVGRLVEEKEREREREREKERERAEKEKETEKEKEKEKEEEAARVKGSASGSYNYKRGPETMSRAEKRKAAKEEMELEGGKRSRRR